MTAQAIQLGAMVTAQAMLKQCTACHRSDVTFNRDAHNRDGLKGQCRDCRALQRATYFARKVTDPMQLRTYTIDGYFTDGSHCEMTRRELRKALALGEAIYQDSRFAVRVVVRGRVRVYREWSRAAEREVA